MGIIIDCFAGGGGASVGIEMALGRPVDIAINHDPEAIRMHMVNHPDTLHLEEDIFSVDLQKYVKGRHVDLMWASPTCTHFSRAKGGKPLDNQMRILSWSVYKHARSIKPDVIIMENVKEILTWGKLDKDGYPIKSEKGKEFERFINCMKCIGYEAEWKILCAADYGAPTIRGRWFCIMRRDGKPIVWPEPTHNKDGSNGLKKWEPCGKYLNLHDFGKSIFGRKKPLAEKTMNRIAAGINKFVLNNPEPFIVTVNHGGDNFRGQALYEPFQTITQKNGAGVVTPLLIQYHSETVKGEVRGQSVTEPIKTIDTSNRYGLVMPWITKFYKTGIGQSLDEPLHTITTSPGRFGTVSVMAVEYEKLIRNGIDEEVAKRCTQVSQFIMEYYGTGTGCNLNDPLHTIVTKDRFALITVLGNQYCILDIYLRMLSADELKLCQAFPKDYIIDHDITGRVIPIKEQVAKIGNSVVPVMADALVLANRPDLRVGERTPNLHQEIQIVNGMEQYSFAV